MANPFAYDEYRKDKIRQKIEESRVQRVQIKKLPKVNRELALKLMEEGDNEEELSARKKGKALPSILSDERFQVMFENPDYQVEEQSEEFRLLNPIVSKVGQKRRKKLRLLAKQATDAENAEADQEEEEPEGRGSSDESSDDDKSWVDEVREQRRLIYEEGRDRRRQERKQQDRNTTLLDQDSTQNHAQGRKQGQQPRFFQIKAGEEFRSFGDVARKQKLQKASLEERLKLEERSGTVNVADTAVGSKQLTFTLKKSEQQQRQQQAERDHHEERKKLRRSAGHLSSERGRGRGRGRGGFRGRGGSRGGFRGRGGSRGREHY